MRIHFLCIASAAVLTLNGCATRGDADLSSKPTPQPVVVQAQEAAEGSKEAAPPCERPNAASVGARALAGAIIGAGVGVFADVLRPGGPRGVVATIAGGVIGAAAGFATAFKDSCAVETPEQLAEH